MATEQTCENCGVNAPTDDDWMEVRGNWYCPDCKEVTDVENPQGLAEFKADLLKTDARGFPESFRDWLDDFRMRDLLWELWERMTHAQRTLWSRDDLTSTTPPPPALRAWVEGQEMEDIYWAVWNLQSEDTKWAWRQKKVKCEACDQWTDQDFGNNADVACTCCKSCWDEEMEASEED